MYISIFSIVSQLSPAPAAKKWHPQRTCSVCTKRGMRRDNRYYCVYCPIPVCKLAVQYSVWHIIPYIQYGTCCTITTVKYLAQTPNSTVKYLTQIPIYTMEYRLHHCSNKVKNLPHPHSSTVQYLAHIPICTI